MVIRNRLGRFEKGSKPMNGFKKGKAPSNKRGWIWHGGYIYRLCPEHPYPRKEGKYVPEHVLVVEKEIGKYLLPEYEVHHINKIKTDNRLQNLMVFKNCGYHSMFHKWGYENSEYIIFDGRKAGKWQEKVGQA